MAAERRSRHGSPVTPSTRPRWSSTIVAHGGAGRSAAIAGAATASVTSTEQAVSFIGPLLDGGEGGLP
jgi:D-arabinose 5-phosphate isomerase GutQ